MYAVVEKYIDDLNEMADEMTGDQVEFQDEESCLKARDQALEWLNNIFAEYDWSEEFVISYAVYCNFFIINGIFRVIGDDYNLERFYELNNFDDDDKQYLEYIRKGIMKQDFSCFYNAIDLCGFDLPKFYAYLLGVKTICSYSNEDFETEKTKKEIDAIYTNISKIIEDVSEPLKKNIIPQRLSMSEEEAVESTFTMLIPKIYISSNIRQLSVAVLGDLNLLSDMSGITINGIQDFIMAHNKMCNIQSFICMENVLIGRIRNMCSMDEQDIFNQLGDPKGYLIYRRHFLKLPMFVSEQDYQKIMMARQIHLNYEQDKLIQKNERMVEDYAHSVENIIKPALIAEVAECLRGEEKNREIYNKILNVYFNEVITQNECRLLKMVHNEGTDDGTIRINIENAKKVDSENGITFCGLVDNALKQICLQLCEDGKKARFMFIMKKMMTVGVTTELINDALWQESKERGFIYKMFSEKINLQIHVSEEVEKICLNEEEMGTSFLYTRIVELMINAFTYGSYDKDCRFELNIFTDELNASKYIIMEMINKIGDRSYRSGGGGNGLNATRAMLERINYTNDDIDFMNVKETNEGEYRTKLYIDADLYM